MGGIPTVTGSLGRPRNVLGLFRFCLTAGVLKNGQSKSSQEKHLLVKTEPDEQAGFSSYGLNNSVKGLKGGV